MSSRIFKSVGACVVAVVCVFVLSHGTDLLLQAAGLPIMHLNYASMPVVVAIIIYRNIFNVVGGYVAARLAPSRPVGHALALGTLGFLGGLAATVATWNMNVGPAWYSLSIVALALPTAWVGAKLFVSSRSANHGVRPTVAGGLA
jgi:hypothetical protein